MEIFLAVGFVFCAMGMLYLKHKQEKLIEAYSTCLYEASCGRLTLYCNPGGLDDSRTKHLVVRSKNGRTFMAHVYYPIKTILGSSLRAATFLCSEERDGEEVAIFSVKNRPNSTPYMVFSGDPIEVEMRPADGTPTKERWRTI